MSGRQRGGGNRGGGRGGGNRGGGGRGGRSGGGGRGGNKSGGGPSMKPCSQFTQSGQCPNGDRCTFAHVVRLFKTFPASSPKPQRNNYNNNNYNNKPYMYPVKSVAIWENQGAIQIFTGAEDGYWRLWNTAGMSFNQVADKNMNGSVECLKVVSNYLFCGFCGAAPGVPDGKAGQAHAWNLANPNEEMKLHMAQPLFQYAHNLAVTALEVMDNAGSPRIISGSDDGTIRIWSLQNNTFAMEKNLPGHAGGVTGLCAIPGGTLLWSSSKDGTLRIWDLSQPEATACQHCISRETPAPNNPQQGGGGIGHSKAVTALLPFAMNAGNFLISSSMDGTIKVWDAATGNCVASESHGEGVMSMSVGTTQSGAQVLLIGLESGNIAVRNIMQTSNYPAFNFLFLLSSKYTSGHDGHVHAITAGPSATFYSGGRDGNVMVWQLCGDLGL